MIANRTNNYQCPFRLVEVFWFWLHKNIHNYDSDASMEQLWLAFVMKEKFNKTWDGEKWE